MTDNKVEAAVEFRWSCDDRDSQGGCRNPHGCHCAEITALLSSKEAADQRCERLAAEVEAERAMRITASMERGDYAAELNRTERRLSALVEALEPFAERADFMDRVQAGDDMSLSCRPSMQTGSKGWAVCLEVKDFRLARQALASLDRTACEIPDFLKRQTGELPPAPMPAWRDDGREGRREGAEEDPEPAQEVAGLVEKVARIIDADAFRSVDEHLELARSQSRRFSLSGAGNGEIALANIRGLEPRRNAALKTAKTILTALSSSPSQGGET